MLRRILLTDARLLRRASAACFSHDRLLRWDEEECFLSRLCSLCGSCGSLPSVPRTELRVGQQRALLLTLSFLWPFPYPCEANDEKDSFRRHVPNLPTKTSRASLLSRVSAPARCRFPRFPRSQACASRDCELVDAAQASGAQELRRVLFLRGAQALRTETESQLRTLPI
eukprot:546198-Pleurochrysis_carterae.AAC.1